MLKSKKGFTLIELIIVVAIMAVLVALLAPNVLKYLEKSKVAKDINTLDSVRLAIEAELMDPDLCNISTVNTGRNKPCAAFLDQFSKATSSVGVAKGIKTLYGRLFGGEIPVLADSYKNLIVTDKSVNSLRITYNEALCSNTARENGGRIAVFLDGKTFAVYKKFYFWKV